MHPVIVQAIAAQQISDLQAQGAAERRARLARLLRASQVGSAPIKAWRVSATRPSTTR
jgi:hypothetical protein